LTVEAAPLEASLRSAVGPEHVVRHDRADHSWDDCLAAVVGLAGEQLDVRRMPWRLHVFTPVVGIPGVRGPGAVAVMQVAHALADGARASAMAAWLFGRATPVPEVASPPVGFLPWRAKLDSGSLRVCAAPGDSRVRSG